MNMQDRSTLDAVRESRLAGLRTIRDKLAMGLDVVEPSVMPQLAAQLAKVLADIEAIEQGAPEVSDSDSIRADLAAGLADSGVVQLAGRRRKPRAG